MNTKYFMLSIIFACVSIMSIAQSKADTIKVWGNCEMCKGKIEKAAIEAGATSANWNDETKLLTVSYEATKTTNENIQKKIASVGYDTQDMKASDAAYKKLDKCCQYKRPAANTKDSTKTIDGMKGMNGMNTKCCSTNECCKIMNTQNTGDLNYSKKDASCCETEACCKAQLGKGLAYIGSSCVIMKKNTQEVLNDGSSDKANKVCCM